MNHRQQARTPLAAGTLFVVGALLTLPAPSPAAAQAAAAATSEAYGYFRTVEGSSLLSSREPEETRDLEINLPILAGDAVQVGAGSRVEAVLADGSVTRLEAGSEIIFDQLAGSPDSPGVTSTRLVLLAGEMQIRVPPETAEAAPVEIESATSRIYLIRGGVYWIGVAGTDGTRLIVREGTAEVVTEEGSRLVQGGEELEISDRYGVEVRVARAGYERDIERWAHDLERAAYVADHGPVDEGLRYQAAPLARSGSWVRVDGRVAWRPRVRHGWRPFTDGRWVYTPSGLSWVASSRWGYVTSHYGSWDYLPAYGWCWFPGVVYSPAWVYWYWGPTHAAWVPYGYYARHYGPRYGWRLSFGHGYGLRFGVYGYAAGAWSVFSDWTFCPLGYFGRRGGRHYYRSGYDLARDRRGHAVPRGVITTDTRGLDRAVWTRPYEVRRRLGEVHRGRLAKERHPGASGDLPDVTAFVARQRELPTNLQTLVKPLNESDGRPVLSRSNGLTVPAKPAGALSTSSLSRGAVAERAPVSRSQALALPGRTSGDSVGERSANRFDTKPLSRPTDFQRAPTTVYRSPAGDRVSVSTARKPLTGASRPTTGSATPSERPSGLERSSATVYTRPDAASRPGVERPSSVERAPTPIYRRPDTASRSQTPSVQGSAIQKPLYERRPLVDPGERVSTPIYRRPTTSVTPGSGTLERRPSSIRPPAAEPSARAPVTARPASPVVRQPVELTRPSGSSPTTSRPPSTQPQASSSSVQSTPSRSSSSRTQAAPSRSSSSRVESSASRSSSSRAGSSGSASSSRSADAKRSASRSAARKKDG